MKLYMLIAGGVLAAAPIFVMAVSPGESIMLDNNSGDYVITYANAVGSLNQSRFIPSTKIKPVLLSHFESYQDVFFYRYTIRNGASSKQPLIGLIFDSVSHLSSSMPLPKTGQEEAQTYIDNASNPAQLMKMINRNSRVVDAPTGWTCNVMPAGETAWVGHRVACSFDNLDEKRRNGLQPGSDISGFGFRSQNLPGIGRGLLRGFGDMGPSFVDEGPDGEIADQLEVIQKNDFVPRTAALPSISIPAPFDAALLLDRIRTEMQTWPSKQLLDAAYSAKLDGYLSSATNAFRMNQPKAAREQIEVVRKMLAKEHHHIDHDEEDDEDTEQHKVKTRFTIDRLAARVLDFDLRYVLKRTEREHEERDGRDPKKH